jgi:hypothetical protein
MDGFLTEKQKENIAFFNENLEKWVADPILKMKFAVISDKKLQGFFDTFDLAINDAVTKFQPYEFVIQQIIKDTDVSGFLFSAFAPA